MARYNGGSNAGHTVVIGSAKRTFHLIPSGALKGKELLIGAGVAVDPGILKDELAILSEETRRKTMVDGRCSLVTPQDKELDRVIEELRGSAAIGTTMRGIGPSYALRALRLSPRAADLVSGFEFEPLSRFYRKLSVDPAGLAAWAEESRAVIEGLVGDVGERVTRIGESGGSVLFEGSQGALLDLLHGSYPYVTSTHTTAAYVPASLGIPRSMAGSALGVMKCYATRVGGGPFPSEMDGELADGVRSLGNEFGATTGRPRRVGWLDLVALRYAVRLNGVSEIAVTKVDVLSRVKEFKVCVAYRHLGAEGADFQSYLGRLGEVEPVYESPFSLHGADYGSGLPREGKAFVDYLEGKLGVPVRLVSHGEERSETIEL